MYTMEKTVPILKLCVKKYLLEKIITSQKSWTPEFPALFTDELLKITSLVVFLSNPRAKAPTTRHTPSGFLPDRILNRTEGYFYGETIITI
jgi:hypothetical protein